MLTLSNDTIARLDAIQIDRDIRGIADWLHERFSHWFSGIGAELQDVALSVRHIQQWAETRALVRNKDIRMLAVMSITQGASFHLDPRFSKTFDKAARQFESPPDERLEGIYAAFEGWRKEVVGSEGWKGVSKRAAEVLTDSKISEMAAPEEIASYIFPEQGKWVGADAMRQFLIAVAKDGQQWSLPTKRHYSCHIVMSSLGGYRWLNDPKFVKLAKVFRNNSNPDEMAQGLAIKIMEHRD